MYLSTKKEVIPTTIFFAYHAITLGFKGFDPSVKLEPATLPLCLLTCGW